MEQQPPTGNLQSQNEKNKEEAITLANNIYKVLMDDRMTKVDPEVRYKLVMNKYPTFSQAYPTVLRMMAVNLSYNEKAFRRFFDTLERDPGKGIEGFIERQADYAKFLYIEGCRSRGRHWDMRKATAIWHAEHKVMKDIMDKIRKEEENAKSKFADDKKRHMSERRQEFLDFINDNAPVIGGDIPQ